MPVFLRLLSSRSFHPTPAPIPSSNNPAGPFLRLPFAPCHTPTRSSPTPTTPPSQLDAYSTPRFSLLPPLVLAYVYSISLSLLLGDILTISTILPSTIFLSLRSFNPCFPYEFSFFFRSFIEDTYAPLSRNFAFRSPLLPPLPSLITLPTSVLSPSLFLSLQGLQPEVLACAPRPSIYFSSPTLLSWRRLAPACPP